MSIELGRKLLNLKNTSRVGRMEMIDHDGFIKKITGQSKWVNTTEAWFHLAKALDYDFEWNITETPMYGRYTDMGHAIWNENETQHAAKECPFLDEEDVLSFNPVDECGIMSEDKMVEAFQNEVNRIRNICPDTIVPGGRYHTVFTAALRTFGWDLFLCSVPYDEEKFGKVLDGFAEISIAEAKAFAKTDIEAYITHDDIVWSSGPVFDPKWYRKYIFPHYEKIWQPLKQAGKKIIFCADGNSEQFIDDVAAAGADGFIFEPCTPLAPIVKKYKKNKVIFGNADCRVLLLGDKNDIYNEVEKVMSLGKECSSFFMFMSNHIPNGISMDNIQHYLDACRKFENR